MLTHVIMLILRYDPPAVHMRTLGCRWFYGGGRWAIFTLHKNSVFGIDDKVNGVLFVDFKLLGSTDFEWH